MRTIEEIAADALYLMADDMDEDEFERLSAMSPVEQVRHFYVSGECDHFAAALHRITGWLVRGVVSAKHGAVHRLVEAPDGRLLDASGWVGLEDLKQRYGMKSLRLADPGGEEKIMSSGDNDEDGFDWMLRDAVTAIRLFQWAPFGSEEFRKLSAVPVEGADFAASASPRL